MVTVLRASGFRFVIYLDDHEPAHVHVIGDGEARIDIIKVSALSIIGMTKRDVARAFRIVQDNQVLLLQRWRDIHG